MRRAWCLLVAAGVVICAGACGTRAPVSAGDAAVAAVGRAGAPLTGSSLMDLSWISDQRGWALAAAPCGTGLCPRLAATTDGGRTWTALPAPPGQVAGQDGCDAAVCVSQVSFATTMVGYLFGPALFQTSDGGRTWHRVPGHPVEALASAAGTVVRVVYDHGGCPGPCDYTVQEAAAGSADWRTLLRLPFSSIIGTVAAQLVRQGTSDLYLLLFGHVAGGAGLAHTVIFRSTDGGATWQRGGDPCGGTIRDEHDTTDLAAAPGGFAAVLCLPRSGTGTTFVLTSADYGSSWGPPRPVPGGTRDNLGQIAAASAASLVLANGGSQGGGRYAYHLLASAGGGLHWSASVTGTAQLDPGAPGATFLGFEGARTGWWISDAQHIWTTHDAGEHWRRQPFP